MDTTLQPLFGMQCITLCLTQKHEEVHCMWHDTLPACLLAGLLQSALYRDHVWLQVLAEYAGQSFRLLAVATGALRNVSPDVLAGMDQQQAEACCGPLDLLGLQVLSNHLRPTSRLTVTNLRDRSATSACRLLL